MTSNPNIIEIITYIDAPVSKVRSILTDFPAYSSWASYITGLEPVGDPSAPVGTKLKVSMNGRVMNEVVSRNDESGFGWGGQIVTPSLFAAQHHITFYEEAQGTTKVVQRGEFKGILFTPMKWMGMDKEGHRGAEEFAASLKRRAEQV